MRRKINCIGIGVQKAGTSWLAEALNQHPEVYIHPKKECHFFNKKKFYLNRFHYEKTFKHNNQKIIGEITPAYILSEKTAKRIYNYNPKVKIIVITRNPVERAISQYKMEIGRNNFNKNIPFIEIFKTNQADIRERGHYNKQLEKYYKYFSSNQILVAEYEMLKKEPHTFIEKIYNFLDIESNYVPECISKTIRHVKDKPENIFVSKSDIKYITEYYSRI